MSNVATKKCGIFEPPAKPKITKEMKQEMKKSGLSKAEQTKALHEQLAEMKANYERDMADWTKKPDVDAATVAKLKQGIKDKEAYVKKRRVEIKDEYKKEVEQANQKQDAHAKSMALHWAKEKKRNALLDLNEELRVAKEDMYKKTMSSAEIYKIHSKIKRRSAIWRDKNLYIMLIPYVVFFAIFSYLPMYGILIAFKDFSPLKGIWDSPWAPMHGFYHFQSFLTGPYFWRLLRNTLSINIFSLIFGFPTPIIFALMLNEVRNKMFKTTIQTIAYLPHFISVVVVAGLVTNFLSPSTGIINFIYKAITGSTEGIYFLMKPEYFQAIYIIMGIWQGTGFGSIIFTSALAGIDMELYEAARIDGAGRWKQMLHITIPGIIPTISIMLIMRIGNLLNLGYETIILLYQPVTYETADVISSYVYRVGLVDGNFSLSTAVGLFNGIIALILVLIANTVSNKVNEVGLW